MVKRPLCVAALIHILLILLFTGKEALQGNVLTKKELALEDGQVMWVYGEVERKEPGNGYTGITLKNAYAENSKNQIYRILVYMQEENSCHIGDKVKIQGTIKQLKRKTNQGMFHQALYYKAKKINYLCNGKEIFVIESKGTNVREEIYQFRMYCYGQLQRLFPEDSAALAGGILLGIKSDIGEETKNLYQKSGIFHLISISGLHISFLGMALYKILRKYSGSYGFSGMVTGIFLGFYAVLCGESVSALRAVIMALVMMGAWYLGRTYDLLSALALAAILLLLDSPYYLYQSGFQLSFVAVLGIRLVSQELVLAFGEEKKLPTAIASNLGIQLTTLPLILYYYYEIPVYSLLLNLILVPLMSLVLAAGMLALVLSFFELSLGMFTGGTMKVLLQVFEILAAMTQKLPYANLRWGQPKLASIIFYYIILAVAVFLLQKRNEKKERLLKEEKEICNIGGWEEKKKYLCLGAVFLAMLVLPYRSKAELTITMLDVGQGDCFVLEEREGNVYLVDGGSTDIKEVGKYRMLPFLKARGITTIQGIFVTHMDNDHISGIKELLEAVGEGEFQVKGVYLPGIVNKDEAYLSLEEQILQLGIPIAYMNRGMELSDGEIRLEILQPKSEKIYEDRNESSMVFQLNYQEFTMLFTGDVEGQGEEELLEAGVLEDVDVLKVAHHGSEYTMSLETLKRLAPEAALISCGANNQYGHPHQALLERLQKVCPKVYVTMTQGAVTLETDGTYVVLYPI